MEIGIAIAQIVSSAAAALGLLLVYGQIRKANEANEISRKLLEAQLEATLVSKESLTASREAYNLQTHEMILGAERHVVESRGRFLDSMDRLSAQEHSGTSTEALQGLAKSMAAHQEGYFNSLDRFCGLIREGFIDEDIAKRRYRDDLIEVVRGSEDKFGTGTRYPNIKRVADAWADTSRSAIDLSRSAGVARLPSPR